MEIDVKTPAGIQKAIITVVGIIATVLINVLGWSPDKANTLVTIATQLAPIIAVVLYYIVNQVAAIGKAAASQKVLEVKADLVKTLAITAPEVAIAIIAPSTIVSETEVLVPVTASMVRDRIDVMTKFANTEQGLKDILRNLVGERIKEQIAHLKQVNPQLGDDAAVMEAVKGYVNIVLNEKQCAAANSILGMPSVIASYVDMTIVNSFIAAWEQGHYDSAPYIVNNMRRDVIRSITLRIIEEAAARVKNGNLPMEQRVLALMEFGLDQYHAEKSDLASVGRIGIWEQPYNSKGELVKGGTLVPFNPYRLIGYTEEGIPA